MRDPKRIPRILKKLEKLWKEKPDLRLIQFLQNYVTAGRYDPASFYIEDDEVEKMLDWMLEEKKKKAK